MDRPPVFFGLTGGIARIVERLVSILPDGGLHLEQRIESLDELHSDATVIAVPGGAAAAIVSDHPAAAKHLEAIAYAGVSQATVVIPDQPPLDAAGILFPRVGGTVLTASTWFSSKWAHYQRGDAALIRLTSGRFGDDRAAGMSDRTLVDTLLGELDKAVPIVAEPTAVRVHRWPTALPQYEPGHLARVAEIRHDVETSPARVRLAGAALDGIGIPACIASGRTAARQLIG